jgi:hypothetical protein
VDLCIQSMAKKLRRSKKMDKKELTPITTVGNIADENALNAEANLKDWKENEAEAIKQKHIKYINSGYIPRNLFCSPPSAMEETLCILENGFESQKLLKQNKILKYTNAISLGLLLIVVVAAILM